MRRTWPDPPSPLAESTRTLHDGVDARIRASGRPDLHPEGPTIATDLLGSDGMIAWQEAKVARTMLGDACWSDLSPVYGRYGTDAGHDLAAAMRALYDVPAVVLADCGATAAALVIDAVFTPGSHTILARQIYGKTRAYLEWVAPRIGATITLVDHVDASTLDEVVRPDTTLVLAETYSNPLTRALDPASVGAAIARLRAERAPALRIAVDDTIATPWGLRHPIVSHDGLDLAFGAGTKAVAGQDRDLMGYVVSHDIGVMNRVMDLLATRGGALSWRAAEVIGADLDESSRLHGRRCAVATAVASMLAEHPAVADVFHPSRPDHPDADVIDAHYVRPGSLLSWRMKDATEDSTRHLCDVLAMTRTVRYALSFDGLVSKVNHHTSVSEHTSPAPRLRRQGIDRLVRFAAGVEDPSDVVAAVRWALDHAHEITPDEVAAWRQERASSLGLTPPTRA